MKHLKCLRSDVFVAAAVGSAAAEAGKDGASEMDRRRTAKPEHEFLCIPGLHQHGLELRKGTHCSVVLPSTEFHWPAYLGN